MGNANPRTLGNRMCILENVLESMVYDLVGFSLRNAYYALFVLSDVDNGLLCVSLLHHSCSEKDAKECTKKAAFRAALWFSIHGLCRRISNFQFFGGTKANLTGLSTSVFWKGKRMLGWWLVTCSKLISGTLQQHAYILVEKLFLFEIFQG